MKLVGIAVTLGVAIACFFDPQNGRRRRALARDRGFALFRRGGRSVEQAGRAVGAEAYGVAQKARHLREEPKEYDDTTLARKVESELFRDPDVPKGQIDVNVQEGVVQLRGEARPDLIDELVERARKIQGVKDVENLLHVPGAEAPMHQ